MSAESKSSVPRRESRDLWLIATLAAAMLLGPWVGEAKACMPRLVRSPDTVQIDYDPFVVARPPGELDLKLANDGSEACSLELSVKSRDGEKLRGLTLGGVGVELRPREGSAIRSSGNEPSVFQLDIPPGRTVAAQIDILVVLDAVGEAGRHSASLLIDVGVARADPTIRDLPVEIALVSPPRAQLNIAGAAGAFGSGSSVEVIDFGDAGTGAVKRAFLQIRANTDARLSFQSENGGRLRRKGDPPGGSSIAYSLALEGETLDLSHLLFRDVDPPRDINGQSLAMDFRLGQVGSQMAGRYEDLITINISPN